MGMSCGCHHFLADDDWVGFRWCGTDFKSVYITQKKMNVKTNVFQHKGSHERYVPEGWDWCEHIMYFQIFKQTLNRYVNFKNCTFVSFPSVSLLVWISESFFLLRRDPTIMCRGMDLSETWDRHVSWKLVTKLNMETNKNRCFEKKKTWNETIDLIVLIS